MMTLYHGSNVRTRKIDLAQCHPYKDFGQAFYLTTDRNQALEVANARVHYTLPQAVEAVYGSDTYSALLRPTSGLYAQSFFTVMPTLTISNMNQSMPIARNWAFILQPSDFFEGS